MTLPASHPCLLPDPPCPGEHVGPDPETAVRITDDELVALLDRYHATEGEERAAVGERICAAVAAYFRETLRPALARRFGSSAQDTSVRYSVMVNEFFTMVLDKKPDAFWRAKSLRALRAFASTVIANDIRDVLRRQRRREAIGEDELDELATARAAHLRWKHDLDLEQALGRLELWERRGPPWPQRAVVIRHRYIDGMNYDEIAQQEGCDKKQIYRLKEEAITALRRELAGSEGPGGEP